MTEHDKERHKQRTALACGGKRPSTPVMQRTDGVRCRRGRGERKLLLDNVISTQRDNKEHAEKSRASCECNKLCDVVCWRGE